MLLNVNSSFSILISNGFMMRRCIHTSLLIELRQTYCLIFVLGGLGGLEDVTGVANPSDALEYPSEELGNRTADFGVLQ